jgi:pimeloyl-ACP methyl ester carboxylesterase
MFSHLGANVLMVEYRGYGNSDTVTIDEAGLKLDSEAVISFVQKDVRLRNIFLFGRSLGGAVAFHLAHYCQKKQIDLSGIVVENTFLSIGDMVDTLMPLVAPLKSLILRMYWDSGKIVGSLTKPVLYFAGARDELVPPAHMKELYKRSVEGGTNRIVHFHEVPDGTHNDTWMRGRSLYWTKFAEFIHVAKSSDKGSSDIAVGVPVEIEVDDGSSTVIPQMQSSFVGMATKKAQ